MPKLNELDNMQLLAVNQFTDELKEGIRHIMNSEFGEKLEELLLDYIDKRLELYKNYFDIYSLRLEKYYKERR